VCDDYPLSDGESKASATTLGVLTAIEFSENLIDVRWRYAPTVVGYADYAFVSLDAGGNINCCSSDSVNRSIAENVDQGLFEQSLVGLDERYGFSHIDRDPVVLKEFVHFANGRTDKVGNIAPIASDFQQSRLQSRHVQKVLDQIVQTICGIMHISHDFREWARRELCLGL
jgi:hypothetical protein